MFHLLFMIVILTGFGLLAYQLLRWRYRQLQRHAPYLRLRDRMLLEDQAIGAFTTQLAEDSSFRSRYWQTLQTFAAAPPVGTEELANGGAPSPLPAGAVCWERCAVQMIRNLCDRELLQLLHILQIPLTARRASLRAAFERQLGTICSRSQWRILLVSSGLLLALLLCPPWSYVRTVERRTLNGPRTSQTLERRNLGMHWAFAAELAAERTSYPPPRDLLHFEQIHESTAINYGWLTTLVALLSAISLALLWTVRAPASTNESGRWAAWQRLAWRHAN